MAKYKIPPPFDMVFGIVVGLPLLLVAAVFSIPVGYIQMQLLNRRERKIAQRLESSERRISWEDASARAERQGGTFIQEVLYYKGPYRLWWTPIDIKSECPYPCCPGWDAPDSDDYENSFAWCRTNLTSLESGSALLVSPTPDLDQWSMAGLYQHKRCVLVLSWGNTVES